MQLFSQKIDVPQVRPNIWNGTLEPVFIQFLKPVFTSQAKLFTRWKAASNQRGRSSKCFLRQIRWNEKWRKNGKTEKQVSNNWAAAEVHMFLVISTPHSWRQVPFNSMLDASLHSLSFKLLLLASVFMASFFWIGQHRCPSEFIFDFESVLVSSSLNVLSRTFSVMSLGFRIYSRLASTIYAALKQIWSLRMFTTSDKSKFQQVAFETSKMSFAWQSLRCAQDLTDFVDVHLFNDSQSQITTQSTAEHRQNLHFSPSVKWKHLASYLEQIPVLFLSFQTKITKCSFK